MNTTADKSPSVLTPAQVQQELAEVDRVTSQMLNAAPHEPHARVISALFTALALMAEAYPCCRPTMATMAMQYGLRFASVPEASPSPHVH